MGVSFVFPAVASTQSPGNSRKSLEANDNTMQTAVQHIATRKGSISLPVNACASASAARPYFYPWKDYCWI
jgi:hypothetical protein